MLDGMTNVKASEVLKELKMYSEDLPHYSPDEVSEALEIAIKALESMKVIPYGEALQEVFDKDFKKEQLINRIEQVRDNDKNVGEYPYNRCIEIIKEVMGND